MANTSGSGFVRWDTWGWDGLGSGAGHAIYSGATIPVRRPRVKEIRIDTAGTGTELTSDLILATPVHTATEFVILVDGVTQFSFKTPLNSVLDYNFSPPQVMPGITLATTFTIGTGQAITIVYE